MYKFVSIIIVSVFLFACKTDSKINVQDIVDKSIEVNGGDKIKNSTIEFDFRNRHYKATRNNGNFLLTRITVKDSDSIFDLLSNEGFERAINNEIVKVPDSMIHRYSASVNSVHYFSVLPFGLNDAAVNKQYVEKVILKDESYHKIKITFNQEGGGEDFEDVFVYWINAKTYKTDYIAYSYIESDGLGIRFREAYNERYINGIRFVDYNNYKSNKPKVSLLELDRLFEKNQLELLSKIDLANIIVN